MKTQSSNKNRKKLSEKKRKKKNQFDLIKANTTKTKTNVDLKHLRSKFPCQKVKESLRNITNKHQKEGADKEAVTNEKINLIPAIAKFAGYEVNKLNIVRIKLENKTTDPVRIHVLPFNNQYFTTKINKRGLLLPRATDDLFIYFRPTQYKYYYDEARINIDSEILSLPIHAYPVIDRDNQQDIFPKSINFGKVYLRERELQRIPIRCKVPLNFSFEFIPLEPCECISIDPLKGVIPANNYIDIEVCFFPRSLKDGKISQDKDEKGAKEEKDDEEFIAKFELRTSQFDFEPLKITIKGYGIKAAPILMYNKNEPGKTPSTQKIGSQVNDLDDSVISNPHIDQGYYSRDNSSNPGDNRLRLQSVDGSKKDKYSLQFNTPRGSIASVSGNSGQEKTEEENKSQLLGSMLLSRNTIPKNYNDLKEDEQNIIKKAGRTFKKKMDLSKITAQLSEDKKTDGSKIFSVVLKAKRKAEANSRHEFELLFIDKFMSIFSQDEKKFLKFFSCIGDKNITKQEIVLTHEQRIEFLNKKRNELEHKGIKRFDLEVNKDSPIIESIVPNFDCKWDLSKNDREKRKNIVLKRLLSYVAKLILMTRLKENCTAISELIKGIKIKFNKEMQNQEIEAAKKKFQEDGRFITQKYNEEKEAIEADIALLRNNPLEEKQIESLKQEMIQIENQTNAYIKEGKQQFEEETQIIKQTNYLAQKDSRAALKEYIKKLVIEDWQKVEYTTIQKKAGGKGNFTFEFEEHNIARTFYPIQYESYNTFSSSKYDVNPRTGFDDYAPIEIISQCDSEVMGYRNWEIPPLVHYPPIEEQRVYRSGSEEEYSNRGRLGNYDRIDEKKEKVMPKTFPFKFDIPSHTMLVPHNSLRPYAQFSPITEIDPEYKLNPCSFQLQDELDPDEQDSPSSSNATTAASSNGYLQEVLEHDYISKIPGLNSSHLTKYLSVERNYYHQTRLQMPQDCGYTKHVDSFCGIFKGQADYEDHISDDEDGQKNSKRKKNISFWKKQKVQPVENLLKELEEDDEELAKMKFAQAEEIQDEMEDMATNISMGLRVEKYKWVATLPSKTNDYNRFINDNEVKLYIL